jgi:SNF2 family DNA or RNA helicase
LAKLKYTYKTKPYSHQKKALKKIFDLDGEAGLFMEMGTGKTKVAIDWASICFYNYDLRRVLVVAPLSVLGVWKREIRKHSPVPSRVAILTGNTARKVKVLQYLRKHKNTRGIDWVIINYESIWRESGRTSVEAQIKLWKPNLVIADESHRIKSASSRQSRSMARIGSSSPMRLALTGTPITKSPLDLFGQFRFLNSSIFGGNWTGFKNRYGVWGGYLRYQLKRYRNLGELTRISREHSYAIKLEDCIDMPKKSGDLEDKNGPNIVPVTLSPRAQEIYKKMATEMIVEFEAFEGKVNVTTSRIALTRIMRLAQITSGFLPIDDTKEIKEFDTGKLDITTDLIQDAVEEGEKFVVFCRFRHDIARLSETLERRGIDNIILSGSVPQSKRDGLIDDFHRKGGPPVFIAQIASGSVGIDLTPGRLTAFYSWDYNFGHYRQAVFRTYRNGQTKPTNYYHLAVPGSIDTTSLDILRDKGNIAHAVIHDPNILKPRF